MSRHQLRPPPGRSTGSPSLSGGTRRGCSPGAAATTEIRLSTKCFKTGSWEDGTRVCTVLASSCLGRGWRVSGCSVGAMDWHRAGTPPGSSHSGGPPCPSPSSSCPGDPNTALHVGQGGLGEVVLVLSIFFCSAPNVRWKTPPCPTPAASRTTKSSAEHPKSRLKQAGVPKAPRSIIIVNNVPLICKQRKARRCSSIYLHS